jgi:hypothetical protein
MADLQYRRFRARIQGRVCMTRPVLFEFDWNYCCAVRAVLSSHGYPFGFRSYNLFDIPLAISYAGCKEKR